MSTSLHDRFVAIRAEKPRIYTRDAAIQLGVSELELTASAPGARRLTSTLDGHKRWFKRLGELGEVKTMTRNDVFVIERWGTFEEISLDSPHLGQVVGDEIDLRLFMSEWNAALHVVEDGRHGPRHSVQLFDRQGASVLKIYAEDDAGVAALGALVEETREASPPPIQTSPPRPPPAVDGPDVDVAAFHAAWDAMKDTHEFYYLLRDHKLSRVRALEFAGPERAREVAPAALRAVLEWASKEREPIMIFVSNKGAIQIHTGPVENVAERGGYFNVLDERHNLHVLESGIARAFVVRKPTADGIVTSVELYDEGAVNVGHLFSKRKPGQIEREPWRALASSLPGVGATP